MSHYNRIQSPLHEAVALIKVLRGTTVIVLDEEETREYKSYASLVPCTMDKYMATSENYSIIVRAFDGFCTGVAGYYSL